MARNSSLFMNICKSCVNIFKWFPVVFILAIIVWSYYAYVIQLCILAVESNIEKALYLILYHFFLILFVWAYWQTIFTAIGTVPRDFKLESVDYERLEKESSEDGQDAILNRVARDLPIVNRTMRGGIRYCEKCHHIKPDRAHHCSVCGKCVLKMDHHCPWVNNCVSFTNYKFFVLFLGYSLLYCLYIALTTLQFFVKFWKNELRDAGSGRFHILFLFFVSIMFAISLVSLFGYHCYLVSVNRSTLESFRAPIFRMGPDKDGFNLGRYLNFIEIFGEDKKKWFLPMLIRTRDGVTYPTRSQHNCTSTYNTMGHTDATQTSRGEGVSFPQHTIEVEEDGLLTSDQQWSEDLELNINNREIPDQEGSLSTSSDVKLIVE
ncbi:Palmitoyltransferase ZDHHC2 [Nymphon striatum]|nr:Palmitoyltransferase ZDHHC2 [Nymphon striatum]